MTVLVAIPYYGTVEYVEKAVRSVLAQTHRDLVCLVVGDGEEPPLSTVRDSRLVVYNLPENRGAYFAQSVALGASPHPWYSPIGSDDWVEPDHLERLLEVGASAVTPGLIWFHSNGQVREHAGLYEVGVFATERLRDIGGYNPAERMGQDTLTMRILRETGGLGQTTKPTYHRVKRAGSLTTAPETGFGSVARNEMRARNRRVFAYALRQHRHLDKIRAFRAKLIPAAIREERDQHIEALGALLA